MPSLLGQFYSRIKGSQEDIATESLTYILQKSLNARQALDSLVFYDSGVVVSDLTYRTQQVGENKERPDISGFDDSGIEKVILEAKFWSALTANQPVEYLNRMPENSVLIFICPALRTRSIFSEVMSRVSTAKIQFESEDIRHRMALAGNKVVLVKSWMEILNAIRGALIQSNEIGLLSDLSQLIGFCEVIDDDAFLPYKSQDFAPSFAKKIKSFYRIIDEIVDELKKRNLASTVSLNATPQRYGYTRYMNIGGYGCSLNVNFDLWAKEADTPFWISFKESLGDRWIVNNKIQMELKRFALASSMHYVIINEVVNLPLFAKLDATSDIVVNLMSQKIIEIISVLETK